MMDQVRIHAGDLELSGIFARAVEPTDRPLLVCLHGGSYTSHYFNYQTQRTESLFALAPALGFSILAIDRPGYGAAADAPLPFDAQVDVLHAAIADARGKLGGMEPGYLLIGHSIGAMLAMLLAVRHPLDGLVGLDLSGAGLTYRPEARRSLTSFAAMDNPPRTADRVRRRERMFGGPDTYRQEVAAEDLRKAPLSQPAEIREALDWEDRVHAVAPNIEQPVRFVVADQDALWEAGAAMEQAARRAFQRCGALTVSTQRGAGHCLHLHKVARAISLRTLAFAEEVATLGSI